MTHVRNSFAEHYHEETKYSEEAINHLPAVDFSRQPTPFKEYHSERALDLRQFLPFKNFPVTGQPTTARAPHADLGSPLGRLARVLYFANGVTGLIQTHADVHLLRAAPSAGALYPTEIYAVTEGVNEVEDGLHNYSVRQHQLVPVFDGALIEEIRRACFGHPAIGHAEIVLILTGVYERSSWRYLERCYRRILLDTGHVLGNLCLYAQEEGYCAVPIEGFVDEDLSQLMFLDRSAEGVLLVVPLVPAELLGEGVRFAAPGRRSPIASFREQGDEVLFRAYHQGSCIREDVPVLDRPAVPEPARTAGVPVPLQSRLNSLGPQMGAVIARRRSTRAFSGNHLDREVLGKILDFAARSGEEHPIPILQIPELLETYVIVQGVDGLAPGIYRYFRGGHELRPVRLGSFRDRVGHFCLGQELGHDAAVLVIHVAHLRHAVEVWGERAYRYLHIDAGAVGQYMNLAAMYLGAGASGIGGFYDDEVNSVLGLSAEYAIIYVTVLGDPKSKR